jgi:uncharacterized repeat protein (TIGR01451 family)
MERQLLSVGLSFHGILNRLFTPFQPAPVGLLFRIMKVRCRRLRVEHNLNGGYLMKTVIRRAVPPLLSLILLAATCLPGWAKPQMAISITTSKEVTVTVNGAKTKKLVPATQVVSGDTLVYTLSYSNKGNEAARDAVIENPVPKGAGYIAGSATGDGTEIAFSVDDGKSFARAEALMSEVMLMSGTKVRSPASPEDYTHVRWMIRQVPPGGSGTVGFSVRVK